MDEWLVTLAPSLRAFAELARCDGRMTEASERLGIPQSTMSRRIHALERGLGARLIAPDGRRVRLTPRGEQLARRTGGLLSELEAELTDLFGHGDSDVGTVRFGFPLTLGRDPVPDLLAEFAAEHPGITLQLKQAHGAELELDLRRGELDLALTIPAPESLEHVVLDSQQIVAVVPSTHPLVVGAPRGQSEPLPITSLARETFVAPPRSFDLRRRTDSWCNEAGFLPRVGIEVADFDAMHDLIARGLGIGLLPRSATPAAGTIERTLTGGSTRFARPVALAHAPAGLSALSRTLDAHVRAFYERKRRA